MVIRKNKKFIDPRYFMDEKTDVVKEGFTTTGPDPRDALSTGDLFKLMKAGYSGDDLRGVSNTNLTPEMKSILGHSDVEEPQQADSFSGQLALSNSIRDAIIGHLENEKFFEMGAIPESVIRVIENSSLRVADAVEGTD